MAIDMKAKAIKMALGMLPKSLIDSVPEMIVGAIIDKMDSVVTFPGEQTKIEINKIDGDLYIYVNVIDSEGDYVRTDQKYNAKDFIKNLIQMTNGN